MVNATQNKISYNIFEHQSHVTLHIDRGKGKEYHANVAAPEIVKSGSNYFCLSSVVRHSGSSSRYGHYVCLLNCYADGWKIYSDSDVIDQPNGFGGVFQNTYTLNNSSIGHVYQYTKIGPTEYLYLKNNEVIAIPSKNGKNNKFIRGAEAHCLRRAIKYFCQPNDDDTDIDIYESNKNKIKTKLEKIVVYKYPNSEDKNKFTSVTLWDYFQDMDSSLIFPYIFQLYKRNWDTWNQYEVNHEKLEPEPLCSSYEYGLCCLLIGKWDKQKFQLTPVQESVYDAINKKIPSLQINNFSQLAFNSANSIDNIKINGNLNAIEQEKNLASDNIQNEIIIKNNIDNNVHVNNQEKTNQIREVINEKNKNGNEGEMVNDINKIVDIQNENGAKNSDTNENIKNEILTETEFKIQTEDKKESQPDNNKTESRAKLEISDNDNIKRIKSEIEIHNDKYNLSENQSENENIVIKETITTEAQTNENENKGDNSKFKFEHNNVNDNIVTDEIKEINLINTKLPTQKIQNENNERDKNKINASNSTLERNKKIAKALIIIGAIFLIVAIIVLLCKIYVAAIIISSVGFVVAGIGTIWMLIVNCRRNSSDLEKLSDQSGIDLGQTLSQPAKQMLENEQFVLRTQPPKVINQNEP